MGESGACGCLWWPLVVGLDNRGWPGVIAAVEVVAREGPVTKP